MLSKSRLEGSVCFEMFGCLVSLLLLLGLSVACGEEVALGSPYPPQLEHLHPGEQHGQGTTVCIEIKPPHRAAPTKVCGPVVHGGQRLHGPMPGEPEFPREGTSQNGEMKSAGGGEPPCNHLGGFQRFGSAGGPPPPPTHLMMGGSRMMEGMMPPWRGEYPMSMDHLHQQRAAAAGMPVPMPLPMSPMLAPRQQPPGGIRWFAPRQSSPPMPLPEQQPKSTAEPVKEEMKQELNHLLTECEEKTKRIREQEIQIEQLLSQVEETKRSTTPEKAPMPPQQPPSQKHTKS